MDRDEVWMLSPMTDRNGSSSPKTDARSGPDNLKASAASSRDEVLARIKADWSEQTRTRWTEEDRTFNRSMSWGVAAFCGLLLIAIGTTRPPGAAVAIATACFAFAAPLLVTVGLIGMAQSDARNEPPLVSDLMGSMTMLWLGHGLFYVGFAAFLWGYDSTVAILYLVSVGICLRLFIRHAQASKRKKSPPAATDPTKRHAA
jgi:hypothetical protein